MFVSGDASPHVPTSTSDRDSLESPRATGWALAPVMAAVFFSFLFSSAVRRPVPSVNEPHYLCKAKHYWNPDWCAGDVFLESSNPHQVFYQTIGLFTQWLTLEQTAWVGRVLGLVCLAWGWTLLFSRLLEFRWSALTAAWIFLLLHSLGNFSGEWLVGGVESKVFAYAFAFGGFAFVFDQRWIISGIAIGLAISFHPIVGLWCVVAGVMTAIGIRIFGGEVNFDRATSRTDWRSLAMGAFAMLIASLPGLIPALSMLVGTDPVMAAEADRLQVGTRLAHHLDPMKFPLASYRYYVLMLTLAAVLWSRARCSSHRSEFAGFVIASVVIAIVGVFVGWGPRPIQTMPMASTRIWLLKFYPFRLADLFVPVLLTVSVLAAVFDSASSSVPLSRKRMCAWGGCALALILSLVLPSPDRNPSRMSPTVKADWIACCEWVRTESPPDAFLYAANEDWAVKWFSHRAEYVHYKDCPQDAGGIVEWARRLRLLNAWSREAFVDGSCSQSDLDELHDQTGITHMIVSRFGPMDAEPVYENDSFKIYSPQVK